MFLRKPGESNNLKRIIYLIASMILGSLLSLIIHALIEINYLHWMARQNLVAPFFGGCALASWLQASLWIAGVVGGFFLGRFWWRKIYIEKVWAKNLR